MAGVLADILFPGRCLLCGEWLALRRTSRTPVCADCLRGLAPLDGRRCGVCSTPLSSEQGICTRCRRTSYTFSSNHSVFANEGCLKELIAHYKFSGRTRLAGFFAASLGDALRERFSGIPLVPVPSRRRGGSPGSVDRIARELARMMPLDVRRVLVRLGGAAQKGLDFEQRRTNLRGMIRVREREAVPARVVLLDDVFTTGATADACAAALKEAGCGEVAVLTLAIEL